MSNKQIVRVTPQSPAEKAGVQVGEVLLQVGEHVILDVLDYKFYTYDADITLLLKTPEDEIRSVFVPKDVGEDLGLDFSTYLMDKPRHCSNKCLFCFVDQMPQGMRETLYFKDDDARLSFLMGNYMTLTNLSKREIQRIIDLKISPINISVHATDSALRAKLLSNKRGGEAFSIMRDFAKAGITMACQIVAMPGLNDGEALQKSMEDLLQLYPQVSSVSIVPVGLTKYREGLYPLKPFDEVSANGLLEQVETFAKNCKETMGTSLFWCSDEFYIKAKRPLPEDEYYEEYKQLENGVGMLRMLDVEFTGASYGVEEIPPVEPFSIATGVSASSFLHEMIDRMAVKCHTELDYHIYPIVNHFFGEMINVTGLITGQDLIAQLKGKPLGSRLLISQSMLRHGEQVFLDDITVEEVQEQLNVPIVPIGQDGFDLFEAVFGV